MIIYFADLQLGAKDQVIHIVSDESPEDAKIIKAPIIEVGEKLCDLYFNFKETDNKNITLRGPSAITLKVQEDIYTTVAERYNNQEVNIHII